MEFCGVSVFPCFDFGVVPGSLGGADCLIVGASGLGFGLPASRDGLKEFGVLEGADSLIHITLLVGGCAAVWGFATLNLSWLRGLKLIPRATMTDRGRYGLDSVALND
jgi:hypothetical protein